MCVCMCVCVCVCACVRVHVCMCQGIGIRREEERREGTWSNDLRGLDLTMREVGIPSPARNPAHSNATSEHT